METKRLLIRRFVPDDWRDLFEYLSQEVVVKYEPYEVFTEEASKQEAIKRAGDNSFWAVCLKDGGKLIGNVYLCKQEFDTWELGYVFNANYQRMGYAAEAAQAVVDNAFRNDNARRIIAMCNPLNEPSWKLLERLEFRREGHLIQNIYFKKDAKGNPIWADTYEYGILAAEWLSRAYEHTSRRPMRRGVAKKIYIKGVNFMDFIIEEIPESTVVYMRRTGVYGSENNKLMSALKEWAKQKGLFNDSIIYGIAQDNPSNTPQEQCRYDVCLTVSDYSSADENVHKGKIPSGQYAVFTITHTEEAVQEFWRSIMNVLQENNLQYDISKPILERYKYRLVEEHKCEFCVPII